MTDEEKHAKALARFEWEFEVLSKELDDLEDLVRTMRVVRGDNCLTLHLIQAKVENIRKKNQLVWDIWHDDTMTLEEKAYKVARIYHKEYLDLN